jgi:formylglycine-generating enzyme
MIRNTLLFATLLAAFATAADKPAPATFTNSIGMKFARIPAGDFAMGQDGPQREYDKNGGWFRTASTRFDEADWDERPVHTVVIRTAFSMAATEVTNAQYEQFDPSHKQHRRRGGVSSADDEAVTFVTWDNAVAFCRWLSKKEGRPYRLPTEAEWEYAARAGTRTLFHTGDRLPRGYHKWITDEGFRKLYYQNTGMPEEYSTTTGLNLRVGQTAPNAWGLYDMHGNVEEWCLDWYGPYEPGRQADPLGRSQGDFRVTRGGSHSAVTRLLRSANRSGRLPEDRNHKTGFRVVQGKMPKGKPLPPPPPARYRVGVSRQDAPVKPIDPDRPFFRGPIVYMKVPPKSYGPLFYAHNHSPGLAECPNGDLLAVWYTCIDEGGDELAVAASRLPRGAPEWQDASPFWDQPDANDHAPKLWFDGRHTLFFFSNGLTTDLVRTSTDNGVTWSKARMIEPHGELANRPFRTRDGSIVIPHDSRKLSLILSKDEGKTWSFTEVAPTDDWKPTASAQRLAGIHNATVQLSDGRLLALGRTDKPEIQERFGFHMPMSLSSDMGKTWQVSASDFPAVSSGQRPAMIRLAEGPLLFCSYTDQARDWAKRKGLAFRDSSGKEFTGYGLFAALSFDEGKTWPVRKLVTPGVPERTHPGIDQSEFTLNGTMAERSGYLALTQARDHTIHLISSKNHYTFNLAWLKQPPASPR